MNILYDLLSDFEHLIHIYSPKADQETHERTKGYFLGKKDAYIVARDAIKAILKEYHENHE